MSILRAAKSWGMAENKPGDTEGSTQKTNRNPILLLLLFLTDFSKTLSPMNKRNLSLVGSFSKSFSPAQISRFV
jgi:hypothetical protein